MGARAVQLVVRRWSTHGGTERYVHGLSHWLTKEGWRPTVWCVGQDRPAEGVDLRVLGPSGRGRMGHLLAGVLRFNTTLETVILVNCNIDAEGAMALGAANCHRRRRLLVRSWPWSA